MPRVSRLSVGMIQNQRLYEKKDENIYIYVIHIYASKTDVELCLHIQNNVKYLLISILFSIPLRTIIISKTK